MLAGYQHIQVMDLNARNKRSGRIGKSSVPQPSAPSLTGEDRQEYLEYQGPSRVRLDEYGPPILMRPASKELGGLPFVTGSQPPPLDTKSRSPEGSVSRSFVTNLLAQNSGSAGAKRTREDAGGLPSAPHAGPERSSRNPVSAEMMKFFAEQLQKHEARLSQNDATRQSAALRAFDLVDWLNDAFEGNAASLDSREMLSALSIFHTEYSLYPQLLAQGKPAHLMGVADTTANGPMPFSPSIHLGPDHDRQSSRSNMTHRPMSLDTLVEALSDGLSSTRFFSDDTHENSSTSDSEAMITISLHIQGIETCKLCTNIVTACGAYSPCDMQVEYENLFIYYVPASVLQEFLSVYIMGDVEGGALTAEVTLTKVEFGDLGGPYYFDKVTQISKGVYLLGSISLESLMQALNPVKSEPVDTSPQLAQNGELFQESVHQSTYVDHYGTAQDNTVEETKGSLIFNAEFGRFLCEVGQPPLLQPQSNSGKNLGIHMFGMEHGGSLESPLEEDDANSSLDNPFVPTNSGSHSNSNSMSDSRRDVLGVGRLKSQLQSREVIASFIDKEEHVIFDNHQDALGQVEHDDTHHMQKNLINKTSSEAVLEHGSRKASRGVQGIADEDELDTDIVRNTSSAQGSGIVSRGRSSRRSLWRTESDHNNMLGLSDDEYIDDWQDDTIPLPSKKSATWRSEPIPEEILDNLDEGEVMPSVSLWSDARDEEDVDPSDVLFQFPSAQFSGGLGKWSGSNLMTVSGEIGMQDENRETLSRQNKAHDVKVGELPSSLLGSLRNRASLRKVLRINSAGSDKREQDAQVHLGDASTGSAAQGSFHGSQANRSMLNPSLSMSNISLAPTASFLETSTFTPEIIMLEGELALHRLQEKLRDVGKREILKTVTRTDILPLTVYNRSDIAVQLNICVTLVKKIFRAVGFETWPYTKLKRIRGLMEAAANDPGQMDEFRKQYCSAIVASMRTAEEH